MGCRKRAWGGVGRNLQRGNDTTTDRDSYVVTGHRVKNSQHKVTTRIYCHSNVLFSSSSFLFSFFDIVASVKKEEGKRRQEERRTGNEILISPVDSSHFSRGAPGATPELNTAARV